MSELRSRIIRLASGLPKGDSTRRKLLAIAVRVARDQVNYEIMSEGYDSVPLERGVATWKGIKADVWSYADDESWTETGDLVLKVRRDDLKYLGEMMVKLDADEVRVSPPSDMTADAKLNDRRIPVDGEVEAYFYKRGREIRGGGGLFGAPPAVLVEGEYLVKPGRHAARQQYGPVPDVSDQEMARWYDQLERAVIAVARKMPVEVRSRFVRRVAFETFMPEWFAKSGPYIEER